MPAHVFGSGGGVGDAVAVGPGLAVPVGVGVLVGISPVGVADAVAEAVAEAVADGVALTVGVGGSLIGPAKSGVASTTDPTAVNRTEASFIISSSSDCSFDRISTRVHAGRALYPSEPFGALRSPSEPFGALRSPSERAALAESPAASR
jgi:hypothetical protein